jgi:hypothetical protein
MLAMRLPRPMSVSSSARLRLPVKRSSFSHSGWCSSSSARAACSRPSARSACASSFSPRPADSACASVFRCGGSWSARGRCARSRARPDWASTPARDHLDHVAVLQLGAQRHLVAVDAAADGVVADVAVDGVREVDHRGAARQRHDLALGREHVDGIGEQVDLDVVPELGGVARLVLDVQQRLQPLGAQPLVAVRIARPPCTASAPPRRIRPPRAWPRCAAGIRRSRPTGPPAWCAATGSR